jgi:hypothetical protein
MKKTTKKRNKRGAKVVLDAVGWVLASELDADSRCGGEAWICDH